MTPPAKGKAKPKPKPLDAVAGAGLALEDRRYGLAPGAMVAQAAARAEGERGEDSDLLVLAIPAGELETVRAELEKLGLTRALGTA